MTRENSIELPINTLIIFLKPFRNSIIRMKSFKKKLILSLKAIFLKYLAFNLY
jgi:hypothetical protein